MCDLSNLVSIYSKTLWWFYLFRFCLSMSSTNVGICCMYFLRCLFLTNF